MPTGRAGQSCKRSRCLRMPPKLRQGPHMSGVSKDGTSGAGERGKVTADSELRKMQNFPAQEFSSLSSGYIEIRRSFEPRALCAICLVVVGMKPTEKQPSNVAPDFSSVAQLCPILCDPMNCSTPGLPVHHQLPEFTQTHVHRVSDAIQPSHPLSSPSPPPALNPSQHQDLFKLVSSSHQVAKVLEFQLQHESFQ